VIEAYPLCWPSDQLRTPGAQRDPGYQFKVTFGRARDELLHELQLMGAREVVVSTNIPVRNDGLPYANAREPDDAGIAVYFQQGKRSLVIACDSYRTTRANMRAIGATVAALRTIQRHGATSLLERAFTGFTALPPKGGEERPWWEVLGVERAASAEQVKLAFRALAARHHPDAGGDHETMARISRAYAQAQESARG
jgi:DnaJ-domain-containing protein 1